MTEQFTPYKKQDYAALKADCLSSGKLFEDTEFPPSNKSLNRFKKKHQLSWKRAGEICENPKFIVDDIHADDLDQGSIGNCWLISSIAAVATVPEYINKVIPSNQSFDSGDYAGIFHFRIWRYGFWLDVVVDDYLPIDEYGRIAFCKNREDKNEMFGPLLEKAYAKLNICYEFIGNGGHPTDALVDLTGGVHETYEIQSNKEHSLKKNITDEALWNLLFKSTCIKSIMGCSIDTPSGKKQEETTSNGLVVGHAYTIVKAIEIVGDKLRDFKEPTQNDSIKLLKVRNPWGDKNQWSGDYGKNSSKWDSINESVKAKLDEEIQADGNFFISLDDFIKFFNRVHFVHVNLSALTTHEKEDQDSLDYHWSYQEFNGAWIKGTNSGGCGNGDYSKYWLNPQYNISLKLENDVDDKCSMIIDLMQTETVKRKLLKQKKEEALGFSVFKIKDESIVKKNISENKKIKESQLESIASFGTYLYSRQVCRRFDLPPGEYVVIPSTFDKDVDMKFLMRIFTEGALKDKVSVKPLIKKKKEIKKDEDVVVVPVVDDNSTEKTEDDKVPADDKPEEKVVEERKVIPGEEIDDEKLTEEEISEAEKEWKAIEDEWNRTLESKGINCIYENQEDDFYEDEQEDNETELADAKLERELSYFSFVKDEETPEENENQNDKDKKNKTSYSSKIIQIAENMEELENKMKELNKPSKACSIM